jgi:hypothetical protein
MHAPARLPHPGFVLALDICITGGCLAWGGLCAAFGIMGEDGVWAAYSFFLIFVG